MAGRRGGGDSTNPVPVFDRQERFRAHDVSGESRIEGYGLSGRQVPDIYYVGTASAVRPPDVVVEHDRPYLLYVLICFKEVERKVKGQQTHHMVQAWQQRLFVRLTIRRHSPSRRA